jgi:hypoxanthine phosphoribosyltransferase
MKKVTHKDVTKILKGILRESSQALGDIEFVVGISRGGLFPAMVVATILEKPLVVAYIDKQDNVYFDRTEWVKNKKVLLVDDIVRTGKTMGKIKDLLVKEGVASVTTLAPYCLKAANRHAPDYSKITHEDIMFPWDE